jgi:N-acetylgalactosamine PTS system EIIA component
VTAADDDGRAGAEEPAPRAIVAGHGDFALGVVSAVDQITGLGGLLVPLVTRELAGDAMVALLRDALARTGATVVFTDLPAGSCTIAARRLQREQPGLLIIAGANVPALLDFVFQASVAVRDAAERAAEKGRNALILVARHAD